MGRAKNQVVDRDLGWKKILATAEDINTEKPIAKIGFLASKVDSTVITVAIANEFGVPSKAIPERSFVRAAFDKHREEVYRLLGKLLGGVYDGKMTANRALGIAAAKLAADMKLFVTAGPPVPPPNSPRTIEKKLGIAGSGARAAGRAERNIDRRAATAGAAFGHEAPTDASFVAARQGLVDAAGARAMRRVRQRVLQSRMAAAVFGGANGVRTLIDRGQMVGSIMWEVVSRRGAG
jgi:hypothetical protein